MSQGASALTVRLVFSRLFEMKISHLYHLAQIHQVFCDLQLEVSRGDSLSEDSIPSSQEALSTLTLSQHQLKSLALSQQLPEALFPDHSRGKRRWQQTLRPLHHPPSASPGGTAAARLWLH